MRITRTQTATNIALTREHTALALHELEMLRIAGVLPEGGALAELRRSLIVSHIEPEVHPGIPASLYMPRA